jgi:translocation protein SEC63
MAEPEKDESAALFFLLTVLIFIVVPWTWCVLSALIWPGAKVIADSFPSATQDGQYTYKYCGTAAASDHREQEKRRLQTRTQLKTCGFWVRLTILVSLIAWTMHIAFQIRSIQETSALFQNFDPFAILEVKSRASMQEIKKAYRKMSLKLHPDKNPSKEAETQFILVSKAYAALADPIGKKNYERYGNPDGPTRVKIDVALPSISKEHQGIVLIAFLLIFIIGVPLSLVYCMSGGKSYGQGGVLQESVPILGRCIKESTRARDATDLLLACAETSCEPRKDEEETLVKLAEELRDKGGADASPAQRKARLLFFAHVRRCRDLLTADLLDDLCGLLRSWDKVSALMINIAAHQGFAASTEALIEFRRCLIQALDPAASSSSTSLLQVPHFTAAEVKHCSKKAASLKAFLEQGSGDRKGISDLSPKQVGDIDEFVVHCPRMESVGDVQVYVTDEDEICVGDVATVKVQLRRQQLRQGEATGGPHAPFFPTGGPKDVPEAWWLILCLGSKMIAVERLVDPRRDVEAHLKFRVGRVGKHQYTLKVLCEVYHGLDFEMDVKFVASENPTPGKNDDDEDECEIEEEEDEE